MREGEPFGLTDSERALFDSLAGEHVNIIGTTFDYYNINLDQSIRDPLYDEPVARKYNGPYRVRGYLSYPEHGPTMDDQGYSSQFDASCYITRQEFERAGLVGGPSESDILRAWKEETYWDKNTSVDGFNVPGAGLFFSIIDVREDGVLFDTPAFVGFTLTLRRNTKLTPERKITNNL